jgi:ubiquitin-like modifier-activating enzyme 5
LLKFGQVTHYLGYNALQDFFPTMSMKPNETCEDFYCRQRQKEQQELQAQFPVEVEPVPVEECVVHEDNEWGISLVDESTPVETDRSKIEIAPGISAAYELPVNDDEPQVEVGAIDTSMSLEELMAQMKAI